MDATKFIVVESKYHVNRCATIGSKRIVAIPTRSFDDHKTCSRKYHVSKFSKVFFNMQVFLVALLVVCLLGYAYFF